MLKQDPKLEKDGKLWLRYGFWQHGEVEPVTGRTYPQNARFDRKRPMMMATIHGGYPVEEDGSVGVVYPFEHANTEFELLSWIKK